MRTLSLLLLLMASVAFVLVGCSDNSSSPVSAVEQTVGAPIASASLTKKGPVVASVSGSAQIMWEYTYEGRKIYGTFTISARLYADGSCDGEYQVMDHVVDWKASNKWHGKVLSLKFYGTSVLVGGMETNIELYNGWYDAFLLVDNGQPPDGSPRDMRSWVYADAPGNYDYFKDVLWNMTPEQFVQFEETAIPERASLYEITNGNIQIR